MRRLLETRRVFGFERVFDIVFSTGETNRLFPQLVEIADFSCQGLRVISSQGLGEGLEYNLNIRAAASCEQRKAR